MSAQQLPRKQFLENLRGRVLGDESAVAVVIGDIAQWIAQGRSVPDVNDLTYVEFADFSPATVTTVRPDVVLSPLVTDTFDAIQIAKTLSISQFQGRYRAVSPHLPNLQMIRTEVSGVAPNIDFDIVVMPPNLVSVV